jgi:cell division septum initiation protein DivIVA
MPLTGQAKVKYQRDYMRRRRAKLRDGKPATKPAAQPASGDSAQWQAENDRLRKRIAELERQRHEAAEAKPASGLAHTRGSFRQPLNEATKLRAENAELRARIKRLTPTLDGEVIKLRKEVEELRGERMGLKRELRKVAKERDRNALVLSSPVLRAATRGRLKRANYHKIIACLHADTRRSKTEAQINEAAVLFIELEELFQFDD